MKKVDVVLGLQWGDEGKGKVVDVLTPAYQVIARFQGGPNAGHSLHFEGKKYVLHTIPSGIFREGSINIIGNGVVIDPVILSEEIAKLEKDGVDVQGKLLISKKAHLILPTHRIIDAASEASKGKTKIGSTLKGIGPTYMDKTGRNGLRVGDIVSGEFEERYGRLKEKHIELLKQYDFPYDICDYEKEWLAGIENLKRFRFIDSEHVVNSLLQEGKAILAEGAQGSMLDIDFGTYPFVTSSNTLCAGVWVSHRRGSATSTASSKLTAPAWAAVLSPPSCSTRTGRKCARSDRSSARPPVARAAAAGSTWWPSNIR